MINLHKQSRYISIVSGSFFQGGNYYIQGDDNLITGSTFIGVATGSGLEHYGNQGGGYFRTYGYSHYDSESIGSGSGGVMIFSGSPDYGSYYGGIGMEMYTPNAEFGMNFGTAHGYNYRPQYREFHHHDVGRSYLNSVPTAGRGTIVYADVEHTSGPGTPLYLQASGKWRNAGFYASEAGSYFGSQAIDLTGVTGSNTPILIEGIFSIAGLGAVPGASIFVDDTTSGSLTVVPPVTNIQKVGTALTTQVGYFNLFNSPVQSTATGLIIG